MTKQQKQRIKEIDEKIINLKEQLKTVKGTECEVNARIVGYYRPVNNFNKGKAAEYKKRITYNIRGIEE